MEKGKLYLIPVPLGEEALHTIPTYVIQRIHQLDFFIAERAKTARRFIKRTEPQRPISDLTVFELDKHTPESGIEDMLRPLREGKDMGLMSEAGCPGVADPGTLVVDAAHNLGARIEPLVGPSSILLALMGSGLNGQNFCFHGYLSPKKPELAKQLRAMEQQSKRHRQTQIFIETPYRNQSLIEQVLNVLSGSTRFCVAADLTKPSQYIVTKTIAQWRKQKIPNLHKRPAIFLIGDF